jgi:hypothetical protein
MKFIISSLLVLMVLAVPVQALTWDKSVVDIEVEAGTPELRIDIPYHNKTDKPVVVTEVKSGCGCASVEWPESAIPAGGSGALTVVYKPGDRQGPQVASLVVKTDEGDSATTTLNLRIQIVRVVSVEPVLVSWQKGSEPQARLINLKKVGSAPVRILGVKSAKEGLRAELKPGATADTWDLVLTPNSTTEAATTRVEIQAEVRGRPMIFVVFGIVR